MATNDFYGDRSGMTHLPSLMTYKQAAGYAKEIAKQPTHPYKRIEFRDVRTGAQVFFTGR